jgi:hypothetical protein
MCPAKQFILSHCTIKANKSTALNYNFNFWESYSFFFKKRAFYAIYAISQDITFLILCVFRKYIIGRLCRRVRNLGNNAGHCMRTAD